MSSKRFSVERKQDRVIYTYDRYDHFSFILIGFSAYFIVDFLINFKPEKYALDSINMDSVFGIISLLVPAYLFYSIINSGFNSTILEINYDSVIISESPIPISFTKKILRKDIVKIFTSSESFENDGRWEQHTIFFQLADNTELPAFKYITDLSECKTMEAMIRRDLFSSELD